MRERELKDSLTMVENNILELTRTNLEPEIGREELIKNDPIVYRHKGNNRKG